MQHAKNCSKNLQSVKVKERVKRKEAFCSESVGSGLSEWHVKSFFSTNCIQTISKLEQKNTKS